MQYRRMRYPDKLSALAFLLLAPVFLLPEGDLSAELLPLEDLQALTDSAAVAVPDLLRGTLPVYARYLQGGSITIRGLLQEVVWESADGSADVVHSFRVLEIFTWSQHAPIPQCPPDSILRFRVGSQFVPLLIERRSHGKSDELVAGKQYWVTTRSLNPHPHGDLSFSGMFPIEGDSILVKYSELERNDADGQLRTHPGFARLPLAIYRECLAAPGKARASALLTALWSSRQP